MNSRLRKKFLWISLLLIGVYFLLMLYNASKSKPVLVIVNDRTATDLQANRTNLAQCSDKGNNTNPCTTIIEPTTPSRPGFMARAWEALTSKRKNRTERRGQTNRKLVKAARIERAHAPPLPKANFTEPEIVMLLSYQRSGSSFMGDLLNKNPSIFYIYEPLDALYAAIYGLAPGWSVPSDITGNADGSLRKIPEFEKKAVANVIESLLTCRFDQVPTEVLLNQFWHQFWEHQQNVVEYTKCIQKQGISVAFCHSHYLRRYCGSRFGKNLKQMERCRFMLNADIPKSDTSSAPAKYKQCLALQRKKAEVCIPILEDRCKKSPIRAVKTVRATIDEADILMQHFPQMKLLHLFRDPRPVMLSRLKHESFRSYTSKKSVATESKFYCGIVDYDLHLRDTLINKYPNRIFEIIYEDFVRDPLKRASTIYDFLGVPFATEVKQWLTLSSMKSSNIAEAWKTNIKEEDQLAVENTCKHLFEHGATVWDT